MARRKFRSNQQRYEPQSERSFQEFLSNTPSSPISRVELLRLVRGGEDSRLELKVRFSNVEKIAQEIVALANTDGGTIVFGVSDQLGIVGVEDPTIVRDDLVRLCREEINPPLVPIIDSVAFDSGRVVVALEIEGKRRPYRTRDGRFYLRFGAEKREATREELSNWLDEIRPLGYENLPVTGARENDIDDMLLWSFARAFTGDAFEENQIPTNQAGEKYATGEFLKRDLLLAAGNMGDFTPTVAAILLFGKRERVAELLPRSIVTLTRYSGETAASPVVEIVVLRGNLLLLYESALRFIGRYCDLWEMRPRSFRAAGGAVQARANYHQNSMREAVANALVHRDLAVREVATKISIFDRAIEISNPRRTMGFVPPAKNAIRYGVPQRLNPQLAALFTNESYGANTPRGGLPMLLRESRLFSGKKTEIYTVNDEFRLRLYGV